MRILTFDIEDWFHILDNSSTRAEGDWTQYASRIERNVEHILEVLGRHKQKATFFCLGWVARRHPKVLQIICEEGHELGSHSDSHQLVYEQKREEFEADLRRSIDAIEQSSGRKIRAYRAPGFSIIQGCEWAFEALAEAGIEIDCSVFPARRSHGGLPEWNLAGPATLITASGPLKLLPLNTVRFLGRSLVFSGGGYFRLCPAPVLEGLFARQPYVMTYFHPRDFDPGQPTLTGLSPARRFKAYVGLKTAASKLERLLSRFQFHDIASADRDTDWQSAPHLALVQGGRTPLQIH